MCAWLIEIRHWDKENLCEWIKWEMFAQILNKQQSVIAVQKPEITTILREVSKHQHALPATLILLQTAIDRVRMKEAITAMVSVNILIYTIEGHISWHSKVNRKNLR